MLPKDVRKLHLNFANKINGGHAGARKFWRHALPRLKYHNPAVSMTIHRSQDQHSPATLAIVFKDSLNPSSPASELQSTESAILTTFSPDQASNDRTEVIDVKDIRDSEIVTQLMRLTGAAQIVATPEEEAELQQLRDERERSRLDALVNSRYVEQEKQKKALLDQARGALTNI